VTNDEDKHQEGSTLPLSEDLKRQDQLGGRSLRIIHLSDLHFGPEHQFGGVTTPQGDVFTRGGYPSLAKLIREDLRTVESGGRQIVCITGDLTQTTAIGQFRQAKQCCWDLCDGKDSLGPLAIVPGNHDVDWTQHEREPRIESWQTFLGQLRRTYVDLTDEATDAVVRTDLIDDYGVIIAEINSCSYVEQGTEDAERGAVTPNLLDALETQLDAVKSDERAASCVKVALVHHHPILIPELAEPGRGYEAILNSALLLQILGRHGFHLLLHGHKHVPFTFTEDSRSARERDVDEYPLFVVCGGSAGSQSLEHGCPNTYNIIDIKWLPGAKQYRCRVETRKLVQKRENGTELLPTRWHWTELSHDDRSFRPVHPYTSELPAWRDFDPALDDISLREKQYLENYCAVPTVSVRPSLNPGQAHEATVEIRYHPPKDGVPDAKIRSVRWSAGKRHDVFDLKEDLVADPGRHYRAAFDYYGSMLIQASVVWDNGHTAEMFIYAHVEEIDK